MGILNFQNVLQLCNFVRILYVYYGILYVMPFNAVFYASLSSCVKLKRVTNTPLPSSCKLSITRQLLLALSSVLGGASALLLLAVPVGRLTVTFPPAAEVLARCDGSRLLLQHMRDQPCTPLHPFAYDVDLTCVASPILQHTLGFSLLIV